MERERDDKKNKILNRDSQRRRAILNEMRLEKKSEG
jgi:hypothetical protein